MILIELICLYFFISIANGKSTFGALSSSGIKVTTTTVITFGTLSTASQQTTATSSTTKSNSCSLEAKQACKNGSTCVFISDSYFYCICPANFEGSDCSLEITTTSTTISPNECPPDEKLSCKNGATCVYIENTFSFCICTDDYVGIDCSLPSNLITTTAISTTTLAPSVAQCPSSVKICKNGGICLILNGVDFICNCATGFTGFY